MLERKQIHNKFFNINLLVEILNTASVKMFSNKDFIIYEDNFKPSQLYFHMHFNSSVPEERTVTTEALQCE